MAGASSMAVGDGADGSPARHIAVRDADAQGVRPSSPALSPYMVDPKYLVRHTEPEAVPATPAGISEVPPLKPLAVAQREAAVGKGKAVAAQHAAWPERAVAAAAAGLLLVGSLVNDYAYNLFRAFRSLRFPWSRPTYSVTRGARQHMQWFPTGWWPALPLAIIMVAAVASLTGRELLVNPSPPVRPSPGTNQPGQPGSSPPPQATKPTPKPQAGMGNPENSGNSSAAQPNTAPAPPQTATVTPPPGSGTPAVGGRGGGETSTNTQPPTEAPAPSPTTTSGPSPEPEPAPSSPLSVGGRGGGDTTGGIVEGVLPLQPGGTVSGLTGVISGK